MANLRKFRQNTHFRSAMRMQFLPTKNYGKLALVLHGVRASLANGFKQEVKMALWSGSFKGGVPSALRVILIGLGVVGHVAWATAEDTDSRRTVAPDRRTPSAEVQSMAAWAVNSGDHQNFAFVIVDKVAAVLHVYDADGTPRASTSVLLGLAPGDYDVPGNGKRRIGDIRPAERTTPAGRFVGEPGKNINGENIVWFDYDAALAIHRVRPGPGYQQHLKRLASASSADKRVSYGCVVVPVQFYAQVIAPTFARGKAVVYILPEKTSTPRLFDLVQQ
jgi:primosomal protein N'